MIRKKSTRVSSCHARRLAAIPDAVAAGPADRPRLGGHRLAPGYGVEQMIDAVHPTWRTCSTRGSRSATCRSGPRNDHARCVTFGLPDPSGLGRPPAAIVRGWGDHGGLI